MIELLSRRNAGRMSINTPELLYITSSVYLSVYSDIDDSGFWAEPSRNLLFLFESTEKYE